MHKAGTLLPLTENNEQYKETNTIVESKEFTWLKKARTNLIKKQQWYFSQTPHFPLRNSSILI